MTITPHRNQLHVLDNMARFTVLACGRRFGKTELARMVITRQAQGRGHRTWWLAPTHRMADHVWRDIIRSPEAQQAERIRHSTRTIEFAQGGSIAIRSAHKPDFLRGEGLHYAVLDEAAFMNHHIWHDVVRPMLLTTRGGALFASTPYGRNWFWDLFRIGLDPEEPDWHSFHFTSLDNPLIDPSEFEAIRRSTPERVWREEYLAEFTAGANAVFRDVDAIAIAPLDAQPEPGAVYTAGVDWGRDADYTVIVVMNRSTRTMVDMDRFNTIGWHFQRERLKQMVDRWQPQIILAEQNSIGSVNIEALQAEGLPVRPFITTASSKPPLIEGLALAIERAELRLLPDPVLLNELSAYRAERTSGGLYRYSAPSGSHDDTVIALALAWHALRTGGTRADFA